MNLYDTWIHQSELIKSQHFYRNSFCLTFKLIWMVWVLFEKIWITHQIAPRRLMSSWECDFPLLVGCKTDANLLVLSPLFRFCSFIWAVPGCHQNLLNFFQLPHILKSKFSSLWLGFFFLSSIRIVSIRILINFTEAFFIRQVEEISAYNYKEPVCHYRNENTITDFRPTISLFQAKVEVTLRWK